MSKKTLRINIDPKGEVTIAVEGASGASCLDATKFLEDALGSEVATRELTADYYAGVGVDATIKVGE